MSDAPEQPKAEGDAITIRVKDQVNRLAFACALPTLGRKRDTTFGGRGRGRLVLTPAPSF